MIAPATTKMTKNQFKCFQCRLVFAQKEGDWVDWDNMQVHLCHKCDKLTEKDSKRPRAVRH